MSDYPGDVAGFERPDGSVRLEVRPGPLRVTRMLVDLADPQWLSRSGDLLTFHSIEDDGTLRSYAYTIRGAETGAEGGWLLCWPLVRLGL